MFATCEIYNRQTPFLGTVSTYYLKVRNECDERIPRGRVRIWGIRDEQSTPSVYLTDEIIPLDPKSQVYLTCDMPWDLKYIIPAQYESNDQVIFSIGSYFVNEFFGIRRAKEDVESMELGKIYSILKKHGFYAD